MARNRTIKCCAGTPDAGRADKGHIAVTAVSYIGRSAPARDVVADGGGGYSAAGHCIAAAHRFGHAAGRRDDIEIGRESCRARVCKYVSISVCPDYIIINSNRNRVSTKLKHRTTTYK